ncbi:MAG: AMP-binding protein, partial [bacterium]|nr:AMP-binding protein [bacterium]
DFNDTGASYPMEKTLHGLLEDQVDKTPDRIALIGAISDKENTGDIHLTYRELNKQAEYWSAVLIEKGIKQGSIVGIVIGRCVGQVIAILSILKAGGAYLPVEPGYPMERIRYMLSDSRAGALITSPASRSKVEGLHLPGETLELPVSCSHFDSLYTGSLARSVRDIAKSRN